MGLDFGPQSFSHFLSSFKMTSLLFEAVRTNNTQQVLDLIEKNECYDHRDEGENWSLLSWAVYLNNEEVNCRLVSFYFCSLTRN